MKSASNKPGRLRLGRLRIEVGEDILDHDRVLDARDDAHCPGWLDEAPYQVFWKGDAAGTGDCLKTFTVAGGDRLFASGAGKTNATGWEGTIRLHGGAGRFAGAKGSGTYKLTNVSSKVTWGTLEWGDELQ